MDWIGYKSAIQRLDWAQSQFKWEPKNRPPDCPKNYCSGRLEKNLRQKYFIFSLVLSILLWCRTRIFAAYWEWSPRVGWLDWRWSTCQWKAKRLWAQSKAVNLHFQKIRFAASERCSTKCHFGHRWWWCGRPLLRTLCGSGSLSEPMLSAIAKKRWTWFAWPASCG